MNEYVYIVLLLVCGMGLNGVDRRREEGEGEECARKEINRKGQ